METLKINKHTLEVYEGIEDMPIGRYKKFNLHMLRDAGLGTDMGSIVKNFEKLDNFLAAGKSNESRIMRANIQAQLFSTLNEIDYKQMAFVCLIHSIDGEEVTDLSDSGLSKYVKKLEKIAMTQRFVMEMVEKKETFGVALDYYFPNKFGSGSSSNQYLMFKGYLKASLEYIGDKNEENQGKVEKAKTAYEQTSKVALLSASPDSDEMRIRKEHSMMKINLQKSGISDPDKITTLDFFTLVEEMEQKELERKSKSRRK